MDWIERVFHVSPDNGDGTLEALVIIVAVLAAIVIIASLRRDGRRLLARLGAVCVAAVMGRSRRSIGRS